MWSAEVAIDRLPPLTTVFDPSTLESEALPPFQMTICARAGPAEVAMATASQSQYVAEGKRRMVMMGGRKAASHPRANLLQ